MQFREKNLNINEFKIPQQEKQSFAGDVSFESKNNEQDFD